MPAPRLKGYTRETVVAEKFEAMVKLGTLNSRMKDFYDIWLLSRRFSFDGPMLARAVAATFANRKTIIEANTRQRRVLEAKRSPMTGSSASSSRRIGELILGSLATLRT
jgi:hypothetical protein